MSVDAVKRRCSDVLRAAWKGPPLCLRPAQWFGCFMSRFPALIWPLPALLAWAAAWAAFVVLSRVLPAWLALAVGCVLGTAASLLGHSWWRRAMIALGFPLSLAVVGVVGLPAWAWLLPLALLLLVYPLNAWRDAPVFPTPAGALDALPQQAPLADGAVLLDAGCGMGDGLLALRQAYPQAQIEGLEWSWPLRWVSALRCPWAKVRQGDIWAADWGAYDMVYLFQRPESMSRAALKAEGEMRPGSWLVSLDFVVQDVPAHASLPAGSHTVHIYQLPLWPEAAEAVQQALEMPPPSPEAQAWNAIYPHRQPPRVKHRPPPPPPQRNRWGLRK